MSNAPAIANHVASRAGNAVESCGTSPYAPPSERRKSTDASFASRNDTSRSIASSVELAQQRVAADEAGHRLLGIGRRHLHQDVGIRPHRQLRSRVTPSSASSGASAARAADSSSPIQHAVIDAPAGALGSIAGTSMKVTVSVARRIAESVAQSRGGRGGNRPSPRASPTPPRAARARGSRSASRRRSCRRRRAAPTTARDARTRRPRAPARPP